MSLTLFAMTDQQSLRRQLKQTRRDITPTDAAHAQAAVLERLHQLPEVLRARRIAGYVGSKGEIDPMPLLRALDGRGRRVYLPVLHPFKPGRLWFCRWRDGARLLTNRYGIEEPLSGRDNRCATHALDLVLVPLLGFDDGCNRLGMGGGYYDRTLALRKRLQHVHRPRLIGLAHGIQRLTSVPTNPWDVRLDAVVTPDGVHRCKSTRRS